MIGHGISEDRAHAAPIGNPHGFSIEWLRLQPGNRVGRFRLDAKQVLIVFAGSLRVELNEGDVDIEIANGECFSAPAGVWRSLVAAGDGPVEVALITSGDGRKRVSWAPEVVREAMALGVGLDHDGHVAPLGLMPPPTRAAVTAMMSAA